jgi:hypothetical protein
MARTIPRERRQKLSPQVYELSIRGLSAPRIAEQLGVHQQTVDNYLKAERKKAWASLSLEDQQAATVDFAREQSAAMMESWEMAQEARQAGRWGAAAQHLANFITASTNKAKARGLFEAMNPALNVTVVLQQLEQLWDKPLPIIEAEDAPPAD